MGKQFTLLHRLVFWYSSIIFSLVACQASPNTQTPQSYTLGTFSKHGATVTITLEEDLAGQYSLAANFTPDGPDYHLYAKDLPPEGIDGTGRPTVFEIISGPSTPLGEAAENIKPFEKQYPGFSAPHLIYPAGPVTLSIPIEISPNPSENIQVEVSISYMVCHTDGSCKVPVLDQRIVFTLPISLWEE